MLTTKKFIKEAEELGFRFLQCTKDIEIYYENRQVAYVCWYRRFYVGTTCWFHDLPEELQEKLFNLLVKYASTPPDEREEPQKFYLQLTKLIAAGTENYLNCNTINGSFLLSGRWQTPLYQTQFTQAEIDEMKEKFGDALSGFEKIPVEEIE
jgi:hypothetical protein